MRPIIWAFWCAIAMTAWADEKITVTLCRLTPIPEAVMTKAKSEVSYLFKPSGIEVSWQGCNEVDTPKGDQPQAWFVVRIRKAPAADEARLHEMMGRAYLPAGSHLSLRTYYYADVFYSAVVELEKSKSNVDQGQVLGCVIGHELGHLMLGPRHTRESLMAASWGRDEVEAAWQRGLTFSKKDRTEIGRQLRDLRKQESLLARGPKH
jgi:hypothetical protein